MLPGGRTGGGGGGGGVVAYWYGSRAEKKVKKAKKKKKKKKKERSNIPPSCVVKVTFKLEYMSSPTSPVNAKTSNVYSRSGRRKLGIRYSVWSTNSTGSITDTSSPVCVYTKNNFSMEALCGKSDHLIWAETMAISTEIFQDGSWITARRRTQFETSLRLFKDILNDSTAL